VAAAARFGVVEEVSELLPLVHVFTHYKLHILPYVVRLSSRATAASPQRGWPAAALHAAALPSPIRKVLAFLGEPDLLTA
jgi:A/G-specific adenine glycosylase